MEESRKNISTFETKTYSDFINSRITNDITCNESSSYWYLAFSPTRLNNNNETLPVA